jgi:chemotaxis protein CheD
MPGMVNVGMAELAVSQGDLLCCRGLGSCVAVALWDTQARLGGLAHVMLPDSSAAPKAASGGLGRYADLAVPALVGGMRKQGARLERLRARLVGGANMFLFVGRSPAAGPSVGERNLKAVECALAGLGIPVQARDIGGSWGRSLEFNPLDGSLLVRTTQHGQLRL